MPKHFIDSDRSINPTLMHQMGSLRGAIVVQAEKNKLPQRFVSIPVESSPSFIIKDTLTGKTVEVPLFAYGEVLKVLGELF